MTKYNSEKFFDTQELRYLEIEDLKGLVEKYLNLMIQDLSEGSNNQVQWEEQIGWVLREGQCRFTQDKRENVYETVLYPAYCSIVYKRRD